MRIPLLLVASQCGPDMDPVSQRSWDWFTRLAQRGPVTLVTHLRNRREIEASPERPIRAEILYVDTENFAAPLSRLARRWLAPAGGLEPRLDELLFDLAALRLLRTRLREGAAWRVVHMATPVMRSTRLHRLGLPLVHGPLHSAPPLPDGFAELQGPAPQRPSGLRRLLRWADGIASSLHHTSAILVASSATREAVPAAHRERCIEFIDSGVDLQRHPLAAPLPPPGPGRPLQVSFAGRLVALEALQLLLQAMVRLREQGVEVELRVVGDGPMREEWTALAGRLGLARQVRFLGALGPEQATQAICDSHVFCLPSLGESRGAVLKAMACGRPVIGMDLGGPAELVDDVVGCKVHAPDAETAVAGLARALHDAWRRPHSWAERGLQGRRRVEQFYTWEATVEQAYRVYAALVRNPQAFAMAAA